MSKPWKVELNALIDKAEAEGKWLYSSYQQLWFSPRQLRECHANGQFLWSVENWKLRDPQEMLAQARKDATRAGDDVRRVEALIAAEAKK